MKPFLCVFCSTSLLGSSKGKSAFCMVCLPSKFSRQFILFPQFVILAIGLCCTTNAIYVFRIQSKLTASNQLGREGNLLKVEQNVGGTPIGLSANGSSADERYTRK